ncbi:MAG: ATP-binding protein [Planctomycetes bacterium]|nr:ATP-binding protein [Planctomycetota bacterium]
MVSMRHRHLKNAIEEFCFADHKIAMVSGPRQCGKTTFAKMLLGERSEGRYFNWDDAEFRRLWVRTPSALIPPQQGKIVPLLVLDEIHKERFWKRNLKGLYDTLQRPCDILVTGSARLDIYRRGSDSMMGRYFPFRLHPFSMRELNYRDVLRPDDVLQALFTRSLRPEKSSLKHLDDFMAFGPFPEPFLKQDARYAGRWRQVHSQAVIREDLRDISRLPDLGRVELLAALLPERVGSIFSLKSMTEDMEISFDVLKRWLTYLKAVYYIFEIKPYSRKIPRSLRREGKVYLWDYGAIRNEAARFENLVALHLLKTCHFWTDTGEGVFDLFFLRNKEKQEIDFLIVRDDEPWLPVEVKMSDADVSPNWRKFAPMLPCRRGLQLIRKAEWKPHDFGDSQVLVAGAAEALNYFA